jgi:hypothetical protein
MLIPAIIIFMIAAIFGLVVLISILKNMPTSKPVAFTHGILAGMALIVTIIYAITSHMSFLLLLSIVFFVLAALGGLTMFAADLRNRPISKIIAVFHPLLAVTALVLLVVHVMHAV